MSLIPLPGSGGHVAILTIAIAIHEHVQALDVAGPVDVFAEANGHVPAGDHYRTLLVAADRKPLRTSGGMLVVADMTFEEARRGFDIILVAGGPELPDTLPDAGLLEWVGEAPRRSMTYGSICTGAFVLGHAGLLDGRRVTTHWQSAAQLARMFPEAKVEADSIYVRDGRLITSAGVTAGIDLALALVGQRHGPEVAVAVAKRLVVVAQRQGGQSQFSPYLTPPVDPTSSVALVQQHIAAHPAQRHALKSLAGVADMSPRNLIRHFVQETGITPHEFVLRARIDAARKVLESSDLPLKTVAYDCGFGTADRMRIVFRERLGVTPAQYRARFRHQETPPVS
ncbi:GlxA family transcriptional regulator [Luteimonas sp. A501]